MNQENRPPSHDLNYEKYMFMTFRKKLENNNEEQSSVTPKRPLLSRDRDMLTTFNEISPLSDHNSRFEQTKSIYLPTTPIELIKNDPSLISVTEHRVFAISPPASSRSTVIDDDDDDDDDNSYMPVYTQRKARPAPPTTWKAPNPIPKSSTMLKTNTASSLSLPELIPAPPLISFQPAIRARIPFNLSSTNTIDKQTHAYTIWLNSLFTPVEFMSNTTTTTNQSISNESTITRSFKSLAESNRWYILRDRAREIFTHEIQAISAKISSDIDIDHCRINPKNELNFCGRTVHRQALLNFISSYNRIWFRLAMEVLFPVNIENYQQMKLVIDQYLLPSMNNLSNETHIKKANLNNQNKTPPIQIRLTMKNLIIIIIFLERVKILRLIDNDPCLYNRDSKFKSTKESLDVLSRDFISSDTNLLRRLKLAGYEPTYKQTSLDEFNYLLTNNENKLFDELKDGIRLTRCAQILLSSTNEYVAKYDLSMKLKCPVVNLVHKLLNIDQAFELLQTYGHVNLTGIINKDIMNGNKQRTLELLWRIFIVCYLPKYLSPIDRLNEEITILIKNLSKYACSSIEQQLLTNDIIPLQKQHVNFTPIIHFLIKWVQLICAHYKFWLYDLQESFADGRAFLYIISYYLPSLCNSEHDIKHLTTLATCQTRDEHIQFNLELGRQQQQQSINIYERNVKSNFRLLEECIKQFGTFSYDLIKYEFYAKDLPDERCTIIILAMLAHDLLFLNNQNNTHNDIDFRHQLIFEELKQTYSNNDDNQSMIEMKKEEINNNTHREEIEIIQDDSINPSEISTSTEIPIEDIINLKLSISSSTINYSTQGTYLVPIIQFQEKQEEEKINDSLQLLSQSVLDTMNYDILDRLELLSQLNEDDDDDDDEDEDSFNSARSSSTTRNDHGRTSIAATMATISLDDFVELEKTIEKEEENKTNNNNNHSSLFLADETVSSDIDNNDLNKLDETCFADPINKKMIKDTFTLFLSNQQQTVENPRSIAVNNQEKTEAERETHAADILQACWRGHQVRFENERNNHPIVPILKKIRSHNIINTSSLTIRERMMKIIQEFFEASPSSLTAYLHLLRDIEPIIDCCLEIRYLIVEHGLLRLFFILMRCCNRSGPSTILLRKVLHILQLFTIQHKLIMKLIDKSEQIKDFIMLLLKYYQNNGSELFEQICFLLQSIVNDKHARQILRSHKSFTETIEYIYKRLFNKVTIEDDKHQQLIRSTPKRLIGSTKQHTISLNQSSILQPMPKLKRASVNIQTENILKQNLISIEQFMKVFYCD